MPTGPKDTTKIWVSVEPGWSGVEGLRIEVKVAASPLPKGAKDSPCRLEQEPEKAAGLNDSRPALQKIARG